MRVRRVAVPWVLVCSLLALTAAAAFAGLRMRPNDSSSNEAGPRVEGLITGFGGYRWHGNVTEISAQWVVPRVIGTGTDTSEATWIGAQGETPDEPFIQLGTIAYRSAWPQPVTNASTGQPAQVGYQVFWSDTSQRFRAVPIVQLSRPGDLISFHMTRTSVGWRLSVKNLSVGWRRSVTVSYGGNDAFSQGEWLQEDPSAALSVPGDVPYAATSSVRMSRLQVNDQDPVLGYQGEQALTTADGECLIPTPVDGDGFSLVEATGAARQYLSDAERFDVAASRLQAALPESNGSADQAQIRTVSEMASLFGAAGRTLQAQTWPTRTEAPIKALTGAQLRLGHLLSQWAELRGHSITALRQILDSNRTNPAADRVRRSLGVPQI